jgi:hypothetical protein
MVQIQQEEVKESKIENRRGTDVSLYVTSVLHMFNYRPVSNALFSSDIINDFRQKELEKRSFLYTVLQNHIL